LLSAIMVIGGQAIYIDNVNLNTGTSILPVVDETIFADLIPNLIIPSGQIRLHTNSPETFTITISDISGKEILKQQMNAGEALIQNGILSAGNYLYHIRGNSFMKFGKLVVQ